MALQYSETDIEDLVSWRCRDFFNYSGMLVEVGTTLVEVGTFTHSKISELGFILYDGGYSGEHTKYTRKGINHRWDWGPNGNEFAFIIKLDGTGIL